MIKHLIIFDILASSIKHTLINWQKDDQHQDETALHDVLGNVDNEDITVQPYNTSTSEGEAIRRN